ncbi:hypothetical protein [Actinomadura sp. HBU206391]|uniref:hypothetical protein n=1 Tax=Actinomadura sp. HBU206391 TaxID=2731692 RepID=UPI0016502223|nr:hypothetical protein [Actinomadura sp. HBU206391]MBC6459911.1 hypothetical protein [Actinomadura sp. HBU206391]
MADPASGATPMIGNVTLSAVQWMRQETDAELIAWRVPGLDGTPHQRLGRGSHRVHVSGVLLGDTAADDLAALQALVKDGAQTTFTADIVTALELQQVVVESFVAEQVVGRAGQYAYTVVVAEDPPLPAPAEVGAFGGLEGFGELGFDGLDDVLGDISDLAGDLTGALDSALDAIVSAVPLGDIGGITNVLQPLTDAAEAAGEAGGGATPVLDRLKEIFG